MDTPCSWRGRTLVCRLRVQSRAGCNAFAGRLGNRLKIRIKAAPVDGRANEELMAFMAKRCGVPRGKVRVVAGHGARDKLLEIDEPMRLPAELGAALTSAAGV